MKPWSLLELPRLDDRRVLVTGAASGIGLAVAQALATRGAVITLLDRDATRLAAAQQRIGQAVPGARLVPAAVDLLYLAAIRDFARRHVDEGPLDLLFNIAGILPPPQRRLSPDGIELGFAISVLGHHALTMGLLPALLAAEAPRVISISSITHPRGEIFFDDLALSRRYDSQLAYRQTKLGALLWSQQLHRLAQAAGSRLRSVAAHPGVARTALANQHLSGPRPGLRARLEMQVLAMFMGLMGQDAVAGALPLLRAATDPAALGGSYWGPDGFGECRGAPAPARIAARASDAMVAARLWQRCEVLTGERLRF